jgi:hypothetical protein
MLEKETAKSPREIFLGVFCQVANFGLLAEGPKCRKPHSKNLLYPRKCSLSYGKSFRDRHPICGKTDTQKLLHVPLYGTLITLSAGSSPPWKGDMFAAFQSWMTR